MRKERDPNATPKPKKPITKRWWFWLIVAFFAIGVIGSIFAPGDTDSTTTPPPTASQPPAESATPLPSTPVESAPTQADAEAAKEAAKELDAQICEIVAAAESDYHIFLDMMAAEGTSDLNMYNTAKTLKENMTVYNYSQLSAVKGDGIDDYKDSASLYIFVMSEVATKTMDYLDDPVTSKLSKVQESIEDVTAYMLDVAAKRITYLYDAGFTDEEVQEIMSVSEE